MDGRKLVPLLLVPLLLTALEPSHAFADLLQNAFDQRQGNYDFQLKTDPAKPVANLPTRILLRVGSLDGTDIVDLPITLKLVDDSGNVLAKTNPILITGGHFEYDYIFEKPGKYAIYANVNDTSYSGQTLTFTFLINVGSQYDFLYIIVPVGVVACITALITKRVLRRNSPVKAGGV